MGGEIIVLEFILPMAAAIGWSFGFAALGFIVGAVIVALVFWLIWTYC
jgi:hypothetical protein